MNTIKVKDNIIDSNFPVNINNNKIYINDMSLVIIYENSKINFNFYITGKVNLFEYYKKSSSYSEYNLGEDSNLTLNRFSLDCSLKTDINLDYTNSKLNYHYSCINYNDNNYIINVNHNCKDTDSKVINHGINMTSNKLDFIINSKISKNSSNACCNQDSQIILMDDNNSSIKPNMLVDNDDIIANHAAYLGHFKENDLFYLESRGITFKEATKILAKAFIIGNMDIDFDCKNMIFQDLDNGWR